MSVISYNLTFITHLYKELLKFKKGEFRLCSLMPGRGSERVRNICKYKELEISERVVNFLFCSNQTWQTSSGKAWSHSGLAMAHTMRGRLLESLSPNQGLPMAFSVQLIVS
jgi:hypothetical protein